jgi:hypothetical protein
MQVISGRVGAKCKLPLSHDKTGKQGTCRKEISVVIVELGSEIATFRKKEAPVTDRDDRSRFDN